MIRRLRFVVLAALCVAVATFAVPASAQAASVTPQQLYGLTAESPYIHTDMGGRRWVYGAASTSSLSSPTTRAAITQFYAGQWHVVGQPGVNSKPEYYQRAIGTVLCTEAATSYSFRTVGQVWYVDRWYPVFSRPVTLAC